MFDFSDIRYKELMGYVNINKPRKYVTYSVHCAMCEKVWNPKEGGETLPEACPFCGVLWTYEWQVSHNKKEELT